jgi:tRNA nucleotidyltransferase/poly(A) polymerase
MKNKFYKVGGAVRDEYLAKRFPDGGFKPKDIDFAVETESFDAMREAILAKGGKIFLETPKYFTIRANVPELGSADYVLCRKDGAYTDGRHPDSVSIGTIFDDLARRHFTCNAMAVDMDTGAVLDPHDGMSDLNYGILRAVDNAVDRMNEDKLRAFRAWRFTITKDFEMALALQEAVLSVEDFSSVSTERIRDEVAKAFKHDSIGAMRALLFHFPNLTRVIEERGLWFEPTSKAK